jgi:pilus assembly protein FimV
MFSRVGLDRNPELRKLNFQLVETQAGHDYIHVTSQEPIREPFLSFLLELSWANGRLYREYTVLLDPPVYAPTPERRMAAPAPAASHCRTGAYPDTCSSRRETRTTPPAAHRR